MNIEQIISNFRTRYARQAAQAAPGSIERLTYESYILGQSFDPVHGMPTEQKIPAIITTLEGFTRSGLDPEVLELIEQCLDEFKQAVDWPL